MGSSSPSFGVKNKKCVSCRQPENCNALPETNMAPENTPLEKEIPIGNHEFLGTWNIYLVIFTPGFQGDDSSFSASFPTPVFAACHPPPPKATFGSAVLKAKANKAEASPSSPAPPKRWRTGRFPRVEKKPVESNGFFV